MGEYLGCARRMRKGSRARDSTSYCAHPEADSVVASALRRYVHVRA